MRSGAAIFAVVALLLAGGAGRLAYIEYTQGEALRTQAERQHTATWSVPAQRGYILDTKGRVLAGTVRRPSIYVDPTLVKDPRFAAHSIAPVLGLEADGLERLIRERSDRGFVWIKRDISADELRAFKEVRQARRLDAFVVQPEPKRVYPYGRLAAHVLGFVGADQRGLAGVEQYFDAHLRGTDGCRVATVDVRRRRVRAQADDYVPPCDGSSVVLTIDAHIQQCAEYHLRNAVEQFGAEWGASVVMDPQSGEILAMAVVPDFDPAEPIPSGLSERQQTAAAEKLRNRAVSDAYEPGSMFKPFIAAGALDERVARLDEAFVINGPTHAFGRRTIHDTHPYGTLTFEEVISKSSNIGMGLLGARCGNDRLHRYVRAFGFGDLTGITLPGEHAGQVNDFARWTSYSTQSVPIGQEVAVTPIQVVAALSAIGNDGVLCRPRIARGVISAAGETVADYSQPLAIRRVVDVAAAREFRLRALVQVVASGTGTRAALPDYQVFGKTGTAQIARLGGGGYVPGKYIGSIVVGAPAEEPRAVVLVTIYRPSKGGYYGGTVAGPAAGAILADVLAYMQVPPETLVARPGVAASGGW